MKIIIPMSGHGERFRRAGYTIPKALIEVEGKPMIAHIIDMFPGESDLLFICNREHLDNPQYHMEEILSHYCPTGKIAAIEPHKLGPVYAVSKVFDHLNPDEPTIINYCDFSCDWDYTHFKTFLKQSQCEGCIPAYRGFHPHSLGSTFYAYLQEENGLVRNIQEKKPFTNQPMNEFASSGTYYFSEGRFVEYYFKKAIEQKLHTNGEYYVSLAYKPMIEDQRTIVPYELEHFMQWGTPEDLQEYQRWSQLFRDLPNYKQNPKPMKGTLIMPMAGLGSRFVQEGYILPKPLIDVFGEAMVVRAAWDLPAMEKQVFILRQDLPYCSDILSLLKDRFPQSNALLLEKLTEGQACTCLHALENIDLFHPIMIGACDNGMIYDTNKLQKLIQDPSIDVIVFGAKNHPPAAKHPQMYGWIDVHKEKIQHVSVKQPLADPKNDPVIVGAFLFKQPTHFKMAVERMIARNGRVNGEFYIDTCINDAIALDLKCVLFEIQHYICWGTPNELRTFQYWQSCFHQWETHPYRISDKNVHVV